MNKQQLEIQFDTRFQWPVAVRRQRQRRQAQWWFAQMRSVVEDAFDWRATPPARPQQVYFTLSPSA